jgi:hypothetical protein
MGGFTIKHPLTIMGQPGTILEIQNGNIVIDFRDYHKDVTTDERVIISEASLIFKYELVVVSDRFK